MTTYYCDLSQDFANPANVGDTTGNPALGPGGFQAMIDGWGNHDALVAGDFLHIIKTAKLAKFVKTTVDVDKTGTWVIGDAVQNHNDGGGISGDDWVGVLVYIDATTVWVQINDASTDFDSVDTADGIDNTTQVETIPGANMTAAVIPGITVDNNQGSAGTLITLLGVNDSWTEDGTQFVLDAEGTATNATNCLVGADKDYFVVKNAEFKNAAEDNLTGITNYCYYWFFINCDTHHAGGNGSGNSGTKAFYNTVWFLCRAYNNAEHGFFGTFDNYVCCTAHTNGSSGNKYGFRNYGSGAFIHCLAYNNDYMNYWLQLRSVMVNCVSDNGDTYGVVCPDTGLIIGCRITGTNIGIRGDGVATSSIHEYFNFNNCTTPNDNITVDQKIKGTDTRIETGLEGYEDAASDLYNLKLGAAGYRTEVDMGGGNYARFARGIPTSILPIIGEK